MEPLNKDLMVRCLNFHGQQLQKVWDAERSEELARYNIKDLDYMQYAQRQKHLSFQDRGKRLKLHQFIVKKSNVLFSPSALDNITKSESQTSEDIYAVMPPFETFLNCDKQFRLRYFFEVSFVVLLAKSMVLNFFDLVVLTASTRRRPAIGDYC